MDHFLTSAYRLIPHDIHLEHFPSQGYLHFLLCERTHNSELQEVFHVYLNRFEIAVSHFFLLYLVIIHFHWLILSPVVKKIALSFIRWIQTVSEDEYSKFKRLKMLSETKCSKPFFNDFSSKNEVFHFEHVINCT